MTYKYFKWLYESIEPKSLNCYILIGPPAVGKSTWIKKNFSDKEHRVISRDQVIEKLLHKEYGLTAAEIYAKDRTEVAQEALDKLNDIFASIVSDVLDKRPQNIIVDMMNADKKQREAIINRVQGFPEYKIIAVKFEFEGYEDKVMQADKQREKERGGERKAIDAEYILNIMRRIKAEPPSKSEGFDEIQSYDRFKDAEKMNEYNHKQYIEWLNGELAKQEQAGDKLLVEAKLSKYWKQRAARRAKNADREWPNATDRNWALEQQEKSQAINDSIQNIFQKELEESEEMVDDISSVMRKIKKERAKLKMQREAAKLMKPQDRMKKKKSLSKPYPPHKKGETVGGYYRKAAKKLGGVAAAAGETIGPVGGGTMMEEGKENSNENN